MTFDRSPRLLPALAARQLVVCLSTLFLIMAPVGSTLASTDHGGDRNPLAQDESDPAAEEHTNEAPPPQPVATESEPTEVPPVENQPTEVPVETKPTEQPPVELKSTDEPVIDPTPVETFPNEPAADATPPVLLPNGGAPTTLIVVKGLCDDPTFDPYTATSVELAANCTRASGDATFTYQEMHTGYPNELALTQSTLGSTTTFDVPPGNFSLREDIPAGFGEPVVSCHIARINWTILPGVNVDTILGHIDLGDTYTCQWYNVHAPGSPGSLTVTKYTCGPSVLRDWSLCPIYKQGQGFDLLGWTGDDWISAGTGITDKYGLHTWTHLTPGSYVLEELGRTWCHISSANMVTGDKAITVNSGEEAIVNVYNCTATSTSPPVWVVRVVTVLSLLLQDYWDPRP